MDSPPIIRPIPRRPYAVNPTQAFEQAASPPSQSPLFPDPENDQECSSPIPSGFDSPSYFLPSSYSSMNLTKSTLFGIYSNEPETPDSFPSRRQTPSPVPILRDVHSYENIYGRRDGGISLQNFNRPSSSSQTISTSNPRVSSIILQRRLTPLQNTKTRSSQSPRKTIWQTTWRVALLFLSGMCYGMMIFHLQNSEGREFGGGMRQEERFGWKYLVFWGMAGVGFGSLLPWVDGVWEEGGCSSPNSRNQGVADVDRKESVGGSDPCLATDWNPVVRSIGVFVGIAFAVRKLPWTSTLQVSLSLSLINPVLWYLIDRSLPGFILSSLIGVIGTLFLLLLNPSMMPPPLSLSTSSSTIFDSFTETGNLSNWDWNTVVSSDGLWKSGVLDAQVLECGIWMVSVLFCSAVCFGGIGRRLALMGKRAN